MNDPGKCTGCGHSIGSHYQHNVAMPCSCCPCERCECPYAEKHRAARIRDGLEDHPAPANWKRRRGSTWRRVNQECETTP